MLLFGQRWKETGATRQASGGGGDAGAWVGQRRGVLRKPLAPSFLFLGSACSSWEALDEKATKNIALAVLFYIIRTWWRIGTKQGHCNLKPLRCASWQASNSISPSCWDVMSCLLPCELCLAFFFLVQFGIMATFFSFVVLFYFEQFGACELWTYYHCGQISHNCETVKCDWKFETVKSALRFLLKLLASL